MSEGNSGPEEAEAAKPKLNEFGEIEGIPSNQKADDSEGWIDPDDLPENQHMTPAVNLTRLREQAANAQPVDLVPTKPAPQAKDSK